MRMTGHVAFDYAGMDERALVSHAAGGDRTAFAVIMRRYNQRLFRVARAVIGSDHEAEDILQESYLRAYANLKGFRAESALLTWLTAITLNEARARVRQRRPLVDLEIMDQTEAIVIPFRESGDPESEMRRSEARRLLELAIDQLPADFRLVFILREIEGCDVEETAAQLAIPAQTVKTRLHRARRLLRKYLESRLTAGARDIFPFLGARCERIVERVLDKIEASMKRP